jgi:hypothetical protein
MGANTHQIALPQAMQDLTDRLTVSYADRVTATVVEEVVHDCYQPLKNRRIMNYVPVLVEHDSRSRLRQLTARLSPSASPRQTSGGRRSRSIMTALRRLRARLTRSA